MIILGVESSAVSVSAAVLKDGKLICENFANTGFTHSVTLLPMINAALSSCALKPRDIDVIAVANGPGSFTGLRIGAATVKGLAQGGAQCLGVSTLLSMAHDHADCKDVICPCMDARCSQVYNALFESIDGKIKRLCDDRAIMIEELAKEIAALEKDVLLVGDGAALCYKTFEKNCPEILGKVKIAPKNKVYQRAGGVCLAAQSLLENGAKAVSADDLMLEYLRLPQAERELKKKEK